MKFGEFFDKILVIVRRFMYGRNGMDAFSFFLLIVSLVMAMFGSLFDSFTFAFISDVVGLFGLFRFFSRNLAKRAMENEKFINMGTKAKNRLILYKKIFDERKTHKYIRCPNCKQLLRVPRGRGKIEIICTKCKSRLLTRV